MEDIRYIQQKLTLYSPTDKELMQYEELNPYKSDREYLEFEKEE